MNYLSLTRPTVSVVKNRFSRKLQLMVQLEAQDSKSKEPWTLMFPDANADELHCLAKLLEEAANMAEENRPYQGAESTFRIDTTTDLRKR